MMSLLAVLTPVPHTPSDCLTLGPNFFIFFIFNYLGLCVLITSPRPFSWGRAVLGCSAFGHNS